MLEVKPNKEILRIKSTMFMGFTAFQFSMLAIGLLLGTVLFIVMPFHEMIKAFILTVVVGFFTITSSANINNMNMFQLIAVIIKNSRITKKPFTVESQIEKEVKANVRKHSYKS